MLAVIGGSGLAAFGELQNVQRKVIRTPYGEPSGPLMLGEIDGTQVMFLARHGAGHMHPPHRVNYRANIWALRDTGASDILAIASVGGISADAQPRALVIPNQIIDYTYSRESSFHEGHDGGVMHIDFTQPYSETLRGAIIAAAGQVAEPVVAQGVYAATQGPRLETAAEIARINRDGGTIVGMTGMPEAALARELRLRYAHLCVVSNWAAGVGDSVTEIAPDKLALVLEQGIARAKKIIVELARNLAERH